MTRNVQAYPHTSVNPRVNQPRRATQGIDIAASSGVHSVVSHSDVGPRWYCTDV